MIFYFTTHYADKIHFIIKKRNYGLRVKTGFFKKSGGKILTKLKKNFFSNIFFSEFYLLLFIY